MNCWIYIELLNICAGEEEDSTGPSKLVASSDVAAINLSTPEHLLSLKEEQVRAFFLYQSTIDSEGFKGGTRGAPIMPRDAVSRTAHVGTQKK